MQEALFCLPDDDGSQQMLIWVHEQWPDGLQVEMLSFAICHSAITAQDKFAKLDGSRKQERSGIRSQGWVWVMALQTTAKCR